MSMEDLREFLQEKIARSLSYDDDIVVEQLQTSMAELRKLKLELPPPGKAEEFPKTTLGQDVPVKNLTLVPVTGSNGQNKVVCENNPETSKQLSTDINENNSNMSDKSNNSKSTVQHQSKSKSDPGAELATKVDYEQQKKVGSTKEVVMQNIETMNSAQIISDRNTNLQEVVQIHILDEGIGHGTEPPSSDISVELTKGNTDFPESLQKCSRIKILDHVVAEDSPKKDLIQIDPDDQCETKSVTQSPLNREIQTVDSAAETVSSTENDNVIPSADMDCGCCDTLTCSHRSHTFTTQECKNNPPLPPPTEESIVPVSDLKVDTLMAPDFDSGRRPSSASQYDNMSENQCEWPPCPTDASLDKLERGALQANTYDVLDLLTEETKDADQYPQISQPMSWQQGPSGSAPSLVITNSDLRDLQQPINARTISTPSIPAHCSPCEVIKTVTHVQVSHGISQNFNNSKQEAHPLLDGSPHCVVSFNPLKSIVIPANSMNNRESPFKKPPPPLESSKPKVNAKYPTISKSHSENSFNAGRQTMHQIPKSVTF